MRSYRPMQEKARGKTLHLFPTKPPEKQERRDAAIKAPGLRSDPSGQTGRSPRELRDEAKMPSAPVPARLRAARPGHGCQARGGHAERARREGRSPAVEHPGEAAEKHVLGPAAEFGKVAGCQVNTQNSTVFQTASNTHTDAGIKNNSATHKCSKLETFRRRSDGTGAGLVCCARRHSAEGRRREWRDVFCSWRFYLTRYTGLTQFLSKVSARLFSVDMDKSI